MKLFLDTNVLLRYLTQTPVDQYTRARALIESGAQLWISETALLETAFALERGLGHPRESVVDGLLALIQEPHIQIHGLEKQTVTQALLFCRPSGRVNYGDALIWAAAYDAGGEVYTFDRRFPSTGIQLREP